MVHGDHENVLIQELARFFLGESVLAHGNQVLDLIALCCAFSVIDDDEGLSSGDMPVGSAGSRISRMWT